MFDITLPELGAIPLDVTLLAGRAVFLVFCFVLAAVAFTRWRRAADTSADRFMERTALLLDRLAGLEAQLAASNARLAELSQRLDDEVQRASTHGAAPASYQIAIRLAKNGADVDELTRSCGLSRQEAELVRRLHAPPRRAAQRAAAA